VAFSQEWTPGKWVDLKKKKKKKKKHLPREGVYSIGVLYKLPNQEEEGGRFFGTQRGKSLFLEGRAVTVGMNRPVAAGKGFLPNGVKKGDWHRHPVKKKTVLFLEKGEEGLEQQRRGGI